MKMRSFLLSTMAVTVAAVSAAGAYGQNAIQLFPEPVDVRQSNQGTSSTHPNLFNTTIVDLDCTAPIQAKLSSSSNGSGKVLVDNFLLFNTGSNTPVNLCAHATGGYQQSCYTQQYADEAGPGGLDGQNPNSLVSTLGVSAIDISQLLTSGSQQATFNLSDTSGQLTSSTLYLVTNCTSRGVVGPGQITGNPISSTNPNPQQLAQNFLFNANAGQQVQFTYDLSRAEDAGSLFVPANSTPSTGTTPLDPSRFQTDFLHNTSFATGTCLPHTGQIENGSAACEIVTLTCQLGSNPAQAGALCPTSMQRNEIFQEVFDGSSFSLPDISTANGPTFHQGVAFLEAKDDWTGGPCLFDPASSLASELCPQNVLTSFSGPGAYTSGGRGQNPNSSFVTVAPVPEDLTTVTVAGQLPGYWINKRAFTANFVTTPPAVPGSPNNFIAAPIHSLTYGISEDANVPPSGAPVAGDITLDAAACPAPNAAHAPHATVFTPPAQPISVGADGQYLLHYLAQDCAGTEELKFTQSDGSWATSFYTFPVNIDTVAPVVASGPTLWPAPWANGSYRVGQDVTARYRCTDDRSGITQCGASTYAPGATRDTGVLTSPVDTSKPGWRTFTVKAVDAAGNTAIASVNYQVVAAAPVDLFIVKLAPPVARQWSRFSYSIVVANLARQAASSVAITDALPAGVTFVKASIGQVGCGGNQCASSCTYSGGTLTCAVPSVTLLTPVAVEVLVQVQASVGTKIRNTATVSSANPEGSFGTTRSSVTTLVTK